MEVENARGVEREIADNAFLHGVAPTNEATEAFILRSSNTPNRVPRFNGVTIDTAANRRFVMGRSQYLAYQKEFRRKVAMWPPRKDVTGKDGKMVAIDEGTIQIPFPGIGITIDVDLKILEADTPSLLSNKDMIENGLDISMQGDYLHVSGLRQQLRLDNFIFIHSFFSFIGGPRRRHLM